MLLVTEFTNERGEAFTVLQLLKRLRNAIIQIDGILFNHQDRIETLEIDVEEIKNNIEDIKEQLLNIINRVDVLENKVDIVEETLINIESNITNIETILNNHGDDISKLNTAVANMTTELDGLQDIVNNIPIVQPSLLNGYIKIDGVDIPVFVGGAGGGGGEILASNLTVIQLDSENKEIIQFDIPEFEGESISIDIPLTIRVLYNVSWNIRFYYEDEQGMKRGLTQINGPAGATGEGEYKTFHFFFTLFDAPKSYRLGFLSCLTDQKRSTLHGEYCEIGAGDSERITKIFLEIRSFGYAVDVYPFNVHAIYNKASGNGGSGDNVQTFKTLGVSLHNEDSDIYKNIFTMSTSENYLNKYKHFKGNIQFHSSGANNIKLKINNNDFELYPVRNDVYCVIDYTVRVEKLGLVVELIVSWYENTAKELITTERKYYYPVEIADKLRMDIKANISTYGFLNVYVGTLTAYPFTNEISQEV